MLTFDKNERINVEEFSREDEQMFLLFCMGIVKYNLNQIPKGHKYYNQFDVRYYDGGLGGDGVEIFPKIYPDSCFIWGLCEGDLAGTSYFGDGVTGTVCIRMKTTVFTIGELNTYIIDTLKQLLFDDKIGEILDEETRKKEFAKYGIDKK